MDHNKTCTCKECINKNKLAEMKYWVFWESRGYMEQPKSFKTYELASKFAKHNKGFTDAYIVYGVIT